MNSFKGWFLLSTVVAGMFFGGTFLVVVVSMAVYK